MKTLVSLLSVATLNLFLLASGAAFPVYWSTGDVLKSGVKKQITATSAANLATSNSAVTDFSYLRFEVTKFVNSYDSKMMELPAALDFNYLRFNSNNFITESSGITFELPENEFECLRFDVTDYTGSSETELNELPMN